MSLELHRNLASMIRTRGRLRLSVAAGASVLFLAASIAWSLSEKTFKPDEELNAKTMSDLWAATVANEEAVKAIAALDAKVKALEAKATPTTYFAQQSGADALAIVKGNWTDVPGATLTFSTKQTAVADLTVAGNFISVELGDTGDLVRCCARVVVDGKPLGSPEVGGLDSMIHAQTFNKPTTQSVIQPWTFVDRASLEPGSHTLKVQIVNFSGGKAGQGCKSNTPTSLRATIVE